MADDVLSLIPVLLREMRDDIRGVRTELREEIRGVRTELREEIRGVRDEIHVTNDRLGRVEDRLDGAMRELIRHATAIVDLEKGQREILLVLKEHTSALALLIRKSDEQGTRIDNVLLGVPGQTLRDMQRRVALIEQKLGLAG